VYKLFTRTQANDLLGVVAPLLRDLQEDVKDAIRLQREGAALRTDSLRAQHLATELKFVMESARDKKLTLDGLGVLVKDIEQGLVDFPSRLGAEMVYLCWAQGEDAVTHYHALKEEAETRRPLPEVFGEASAGKVARA
jgi:hypothetical protein